MTKEKESLRPPLFTTFRYHFFLSNAQRRMDALQANHERPTNPCEEVHPFNGVHPHGPPCESRAEAPEPSCLRSIARNRGAMVVGIVVTLVLLAGDSQPLRTTSPNKCSKLFFSPLPLLSVLWRLLQRRLLLHALMPRFMGWEMASTAYELQMVAALMLTALQPPTRHCHLERDCA